MNKIDGNYLHDLTVGNSNGIAVQNVRDIFSSEIGSPLPRAGCMWIGPVHRDVRFQTFFRLSSFPRKLATGGVYLLLPVHDKRSKDAFKWFRVDDPTVLIALVKSFSFWFLAYFFCIICCRFPTRYDAPSSAFICFTLWQMYKVLSCSFIVVTNDQLEFKFPLLSHCLTNNNSK